MTPPVARIPAPPKRAPFVIRLFTSPVTAGAVERRLRRTLKPAAQLALAFAPVTFALLLLLLGAEMWAHRAPVLAPRHRAEALCFALAARPRFAPPMAVETSAAMVRGRFAPGTPAALALRQAMHFDDPQISDESRQRIGDYDVTTLWLRVPERGETRHWLVVGWMEDGDLAVCSFRFAGDDPDLSYDQKVWGRRLLQRILLPAYFQAGAMPRVYLSAPDGIASPRFGPDTRG